MISWWEKAAEHSHGRNVNDERIVRRSVLGGEYPACGIGVESECTESVDGLSWKDHALFPVY